jgi:hypothetical protein
MSMQAFVPTANAGTEHFRAEIAENAEMSPFFSASSALSARSDSYWAPRFAGMTNEGETGL